ncbi:DUF4190 domain-containing protein [Agrococcus beijingensis]|uniref:DUF4190 domain-containing protein n=1 Tax=Agrococcus beijingensis TaxID=3068634 RepID=UPI0027419A69|nr:DUF4190 domain-containing protein [Agrococcus sp. REN33]
MAGEADRFRPRDPSPSQEREGSVSERTPRTAPSSMGPADRQAPPPQQPQSYAWPQPQQSPRQSAPTYPPTQYAAPRFTAGAAPGRDAPLIHPAAAQVGGQMPYGVPVYRAPVYAYAPPPQRGLSITALVLGICSAVFAWTLVVVPLIGIVFGFLALRREPAGRAMAITGLITSGLGIVWIALFYVLPFLGALGAIFLGMGFV